VTPSWDEDLLRLSGGIALGETKALTWGKHTVAVLIRLNGGAGPVSDDSSVYGRASACHDVRSLRGVLKHPGFGGAAELTPEGRAG
jgi:hypothetical protein